MLSFEEGFIESQQLNQRLLQTIRLLGEYKGKQELFKQQAPQVLGTLRQAAVIQSTESSNRIEGITVPKTCGACCLNNSCFPLYSPSKRIVCRSLWLSC